MDLLKRLSCVCVMLVLLPGCPPEEENNNNTNNNNTNNPDNIVNVVDRDTGNNITTTDMGNTSGDMGNNGDMGTNGTDAGTNGDMGQTSPWTLSSHPCAGNRTDALWCDDSDNCFVSCGTTTNGDTGFYETTDGGANWTQFATTNPTNFFDSARVNTISRSADGLLYVGGDLPNSAAVVSVDDTGVVAEVFTRSNQVGTSFTVGTFRRASNQWAIAESLNGTDVIYREADGGDPTDSWTNGNSFYGDGDADDVSGGVQILDMELDGDEFWGVGSRINQPPHVFVPKLTTGDFDFHIVPLATGLGEFNGELWGIDVNADGVAVGGVNQDNDYGVVYTIDSASDATDASNWTAFNLSTLFANQTTWVTDVCRGPNDTVYAVGRESSEGWGFVLMSSDGGTSFEDITPYDANGDSEFDDVSRCQAFDDGLIIAGAGGLFARYF